MREGRGGSFDQTAYLIDKDRAYARLINPTRTRGRPIAEEFGYDFFDVAHTEAQSAQTAMHVFGRRAIGLVASGEASWRDVASLELLVKISEQMARKGTILHRHRDIPELDFSFMVGTNRKIFGYALDHLFDSLARLATPGSRINHIQGIATISNPPRPRSVTLPIVEKLLGNPESQEFKDVRRLLTTSSRALLTVGRGAKDRFLDRLQVIGREHKDDAPDDGQRKKLKQKKQFDARRQLWHETYPVISSAMSGVDSFTIDQKADFAWNSSMVYVASDPNFADLNYLNDLL